MTPLGRDSLSSQANQTATYLTRYRSLTSEPHNVRENKSNLWWIVPPRLGKSRLYFFKFLPFIAPFLRLCAFDSDADNCRRTACFALDICDRPSLSGSLHCYNNA